MYLMKGSKEDCKNFRKFFNFIKKVEEEGLPECQHGKGVFKMSVVSP